MNDPPETGYRAAPSQPAFARGRWLAGVALLLSVVGLLVGLAGFVIAWLTTAHFSPAA